MRRVHHEAHYFIRQCNRLCLYCEYAINWLIINNIMLVQFVMQTTFYRKINQYISHILFDWFNTVRMVTWQLSTSLLSIFLLENLMHKTQINQFYYNSIQLHLILGHAYMVHQRQNRVQHHQQNGAISSRSFMHLYAIVPTTFSNHIVRL
jgi:hypothetical protein